MKTKPDHDLLETGFNLMSKTPSIRDLSAWAEQEVARADCRVSRRDIHLLLMAASGMAREDLLSQPDQPVQADETALFRSYIQRRCLHEPVHRIIGRREFHGLDIELNEASLEPRDDTECLVEATLQMCTDRTHPWKFLDLGTGPGTVALALLHDLPNAVALGVDRQTSALEMARKNAQTAGLSARFSTLESDWLEMVEGRYDFIVSNPPYIATEIIDSLDAQVRLFDPVVALDGGADGLQAHRQILAKSSAYLRSNGFLALEIGYDQSREVRLLAEQFGWKNFNVKKDLAGNDRVVLVS